MTQGQKAQTAIELAVFGAILIFVLGGIFSSTVNSANRQHSILKATRMAMQMSHKTTETKRIASRNYSTVMIVEDRLTTSSGKYGAIDRVPYMSQGAAVHSANLFMPVDFGDSEDIPVIDVFVNGKHFVFTLSNHVSVELAKPCAGVGGSCPAECGGDCTASSVQYYPGADVPASEWDPNCVKRTVTEKVACAGAPNPCPAECGGDCSAASLGVYTQITITHIGCARLTTIVDNHPLIEKWCDHDGGADLKRCPVACSASLEPGCNFSADERFDLDRNDLDGLPGDVVVPLAERSSFAWQWYLVAGVNEKKTSDTTSSYDVSELHKDDGPATGPVTGIVSIDTVIMGDGIVLPGGESKTKNAQLDVDGDLKIEYIMQSSVNTTGESGVIMRLAVQDRQEGDVDFSYDDSDKARGIFPPGFTKDVRVYTRVRDAGPDGGTYFEIHEGQLFSTSGDMRQYIRTASKKDQIDIVERVFRLSNDTDRFCDRNDDVTGPASPDYASPASPDYAMAAWSVGANPPNPVEVCGKSPGECFSSANLDKTCMDVANKLLFIRSRVADLHGRKWVTDTSKDPYIEFMRN